MADLRLKTEKYTIDGREYTLVCNMNVLAEIQEMNDGDFREVLNKSKSIRNALVIGAAMANECAEINGWPERFTEKTLGRLIPPKETGKFSSIITSLLYSALIDDEQKEKTENRMPGETEKN